MKISNNGLGTCSAWGVTGGDTEVSHHDSKAAVHGTGLDHGRNPALWAAGMSEQKAGLGDLNATRSCVWGREPLGAGSERAPKPCSSASVGRWSLNPCPQHQCCRGASAPGPWHRVPFLSPYGSLKGAESVVVLWIDTGLKTEGSAGPLPFRALSVLMTVASALPQLMR